MTPSPLATEELPGSSTARGGTGRGETGRLPDLADLKRTMGHFATGVTVITALDGAEPVGFACQSFVSLSLEPPLVAFAASRSSSSWPRIAATGRFCVNVLSSDQHELCGTFGSSGGDKFAAVAWRPSSFGSPRIDGALAWIDCELELVHEAGDHQLAIGRVREAGGRDADGREVKPLVYYRSGFGHFAPFQG